MLETITQSTPAHDVAHSGNHDERHDERKLIYARLMVASTNQPNDDALACMLASLSLGSGDMPVRLGLDEAQYTEMLTTHYPGIDMNKFSIAKAEEKIDRSDEQGELFELLYVNKADSDPSRKWMAQIVVAGCMGGNHLWQDLGLWCREDLTRLMETNFPELALRNDKNMKWKKFLYKQLCVQEGIYTCRAPSCEVCVDYASCFAPE